MSSYKIVFLGEAASGKSVAIRRILTNTYEHRYVATMGVDVHQLDLQLHSTQTNKTSKVSINIWDTGGTEKFGGLREGYYIQANAAVIFHRANDDITRIDEVVERWIRDFHRVVPNAPIYLALTDCQDETRLVPYNSIKCVGTCILNPRTNRNLFRPIISLVRALSGDKSLVMVE
jgi:GTP-binding nuclear protein Ran